eukprot:14621977-Alexandrium_andersonii.AAC.1
MKGLGALPLLVAAQCAPHAPGVGQHGEPFNPQSQRLRASPAYCQLGTTSCAVEAIHAGWPGPS